MINWKDAINFPQRNMIKVGMRFQLRKNTNRDDWSFDPFISDTNKYTKIKLVTGYDTNGIWLDEHWHMSYTFLKTHFNFLGY